MPQGGPLLQNMLDTAVQLDASTLMRHPGLDISSRANKQVSQPSFHVVLCLGGWTIVFRHAFVFENSGGEDVRRYAKIFVYLREVEAGEIGRRYTQICDHFLQCLGHWRCRRPIVVLV